MSRSDVQAGDSNPNPLTVEYCGRELTFDRVPARAFAEGQNSAEVFLLLGLGDDGVGTALWVGPVLEALKRSTQESPVAELDPSFEGILAISRICRDAVPMADWS